MIIMRVFRPTMGAWAKAFCCRGPYLNALVMASKLLQRHPWPFIHSCYTYSAFKALEELGLNSAVVVMGVFRLTMGAWVQAFCFNILVVSSKLFKAECARELLQLEGMFVRPFKAESGCNQLFTSLLLTVCWFRPMCVTYTGLTCG